MTLLSTAMLDRVRDAVSAVCDPEFPNVTIEQLGVLEDVRVVETDVEVDLIPTFLGCPALEVIEADVRVAVLSVEGVGRVEVRFVTGPTWTPDRITDQGRLNLGDLTVSVRDQVGEAVCPVCGSRHVVERSPFGPTACRAIAFCEDCRNPVEVIRQ
ncbi:MAG TPA: 1,2-phenylacetyl-CoA epoxidase subunit PaaD [Acidimicrobiia bacterium]